MSLTLTPGLAAETVIPRRQGEALWGPGFLQSLVFGIPWTAYEPTSPQINTRPSTALLFSLGLI